LDLCITDKTILEKEEGFFHKIDTFSHTDDMETLKNRACHFKETVLEFNPDAPEQIDLRDKHLACTENLGGHVRKIISEQFKIQRKTYEEFVAIYQSDRPSWFEKLLSGLSQGVEQLSPDLHNLKLNRFHCALEYIPGISTPLRTYFLGFEQSRTDMEQVIESLKHGVEWLQQKSSLLLEHMERLTALSQSLDRAICLGRLMDGALSDAMTNEVPKGDPRKRFINDELLCRLRLRMDILRLQMDSNRLGLITLEILYRNNQELIRGLEQSKDAIVNAFNLGAVCSYAITHQKIIHGGLGQNLGELELPDRSIKPAQHMENLKLAFNRVLSCDHEIRAFMAGVGPIVERTLSDLIRLQKKTDSTFLKMKKTSTAGMGDELFDP